MLTPEKIYNDVKKSNLSLNDGIEHLRLFIEQSNSAKVRAKCIDVAIKLMRTGEDLFKILENYLISDESPRVRSMAAKKIMYNFPNKCITPLTWIIQHDESAVVIKKILNIVEDPANQHLSVLRKEIENRFLTRYGVSGGEAKFFLDFEIFYPDLIKESRISKKIQEGHVVALRIGIDIARIPKSLSNLKWLKSLDLSFNHGLNNIPTSIETLARQNFSQKYIDEGVNPNDAVVLGILETFVGKKLIDAIPGDDDYHFYHKDKKGNVVKIIIGGSEYFYIRIIPKQIYLLKNLQELYLSFNGIESLPITIGRLKSLKKLNLSFNKIKKLPKSIGDLKSLEELVLQKNELQELPESIGNLDNLKRLFLSENKLKKIPNSIGNLKSLELLDLSENNISEFPDSIGKLSYLKDLYLYRNNIRKVPESIKNLKILKNLEI